MGVSKLSSGGRLFRRVFLPRGVVVYFENRISLGLACFFPAIFLSEEVGNF